MYVYMYQNNKKYVFGILSFDLYVRMYSCTYPIENKYKGYFYWTMSINIPLFFQNNCEYVSKHYKSSKLLSCPLGHGPILKPVTTFSFMLCVLLVYSFTKWLLNWPSHAYHISMGSRKQCKMDLCYQFYNLKFISSNLCTVSLLKIFP